MEMQCTAVSYPFPAFLYLAINEFNESFAEMLIKFVSLTKSMVVFTFVITGL